MAETSHKIGTNLLKVLMLAYVFPPFFSLGGSIRVVKFMKYLPKLNWLPVVLTIDDSRDYDTQRKQGSESLLIDISPQVKIFRTSAGEPPLEFLIKGRELRQKNRLTAVFINLLRDIRQSVSKNILLPDEKITWLPFAVRMGREIVKNEGIDVIFVTCPPHSVSLIGVALKKLSQKPLIVDYRDDWIDTPWFFTKPQFIQWLERRLEKMVVRTADRVVLVTDWSKQAFEDRYPDEHPDKFVLIPNGCDLEDYQFLRGKLRPPSSKFTIVHAGLLSDADDWRRSPQAFFQAIRNLIDQHSELATNLNVIFTGYLPELYRLLVSKLGLSNVIIEAGFLQRLEFLNLLHSADLLLTINYEGYSTLVPGKIYDYWAVGGPPILLLSCNGAAQSLIERHQLGMTVPSLDVVAIQEAVFKVYYRREAGHPIRLSTDGIVAYDRRVLSKKLAQTLENVFTNARG